MSPLGALESRSVYILREVRARVQRPAMLWSFGKDSTVMLHLARKAFFGALPFPLLHCDTGLEMEESYAFRDRLVRDWALELLTVTCPPLEATDPALPAAARVAARKTLGLKAAMREHGFTGILAGIRRDEEGTRAKERYFSPRTAEGGWDAARQPPEFWDQFTTAREPGGSLRIHPLLHWTEADIWRYTLQEDLPVNPLYFARQGEDDVPRRFRSIGEKGITFPVASDAATLAAILDELESTRVAERSGRPMGADEDESSFERLRKAGYM